MSILLYPSDLSDAEWSVLAPLLPTTKVGGRPPLVDLRRVLNGLFSLVRSGCAWRYVPRDYGPWSTVYHYFRAWRNDGVWESLHTRLRELARQHVGRDPTPNAAILDSQSVKTQQGGPRGFDGAKKVSGRRAPPIYLQIVSSVMIANHESRRTHVTHLRARKTLSAYRMFERLISVSRRARSPLLRTTTETDTSNIACLVGAVSDRY